MDTINVPELEKELEAMKRELDVLARPALKKGGSIAQDWLKLSNRMDRCERELNKIKTRPLAA